jgi:hypothetical protein
MGEGYPAIERGEGLPAVGGGGSLMFPIVLVFVTTQSIAFKYVMASGPCTSTPDLCRFAIHLLFKIDF